MSEIEIPKDGKEAWQVHDKQYSLSDEAVKELGVHDGDARCNILSDLAVFLLAGWMRSEFYHIHAQHEFNCRVFECHTKADPSHTWDDEQWLAAARARLEERDG